MAPAFPGMLSLAHANSQKAKARKSFIQTGQGCRHSGCLDGSAPRAAGMCPILCLTLRNAIAIAGQARRVSHVVQRGARTCAKAVDLAALGCALKRGRKRNIDFLLVPQNRPKRDILRRRTHLHLHSSPRLTHAKLSRDDHIMLQQEVVRGMQSACHRAVHATANLRHALCSA